MDIVPFKSGTSKVSPQQRVQMSPEAQNDIKYHFVYGYDFYQINLYVFNKFVQYKLKLLKTIIS